MRHRPLPRIPLELIAHDLEQAGLLHDPSLKQTGARAYTSSEPARHLLEEFTHRHDHPPSRFALLPPNLVLLR
jgi:hypothetical protein